MKHNICGFVIDLEQKDAFSNDRVDMFDSFFERHPLGIVLPNSVILVT